jgi:cyclopropane fatty-acyl-phospholipid synthase-like methyltransferase
MSVSTDTHVRTIVAACDLTDSQRIVDVGGGRGALITALLQANPHVQGLLFDRDAVTPQTQRRIAEAGLADRCEVRGGSFLEEVPTGGDTYFIKHVLHDWPDDGVRTILRNVRRAMSPTSRLLIVEMLTEHGEFGRDFACKWYDFVQMVGPGGRERTLAEFETLLTEAGFRLHRVTPTELWDVTFLEALPA